MEASALVTTVTALVLRCSRAGWDVSENTIAKIEAQIRWVTDRELALMAQALRVDPSELFPPRLRGARRD
jgi:transcriptional regulator with XRE-family HTH domain